MSETEEKMLKVSLWLLVINLVFYLIFFIGSYFDPFMANGLKQLNTIYFIFIFGPIILFGSIETIEFSVKKLKLILKKPKR